MAGPRTAGLRSGQVAQLDRGGLMGWIRSRIPRRLKAAVWSRAWLVSVLTGQISPVVDRVGRWGGVTTSTAAPAEILSRHCAGWVLFGRTEEGGDPLVWRWFSTRGVITRETARVPQRELGRWRRSDLQVRFNQNTEAVIECCREGREGWLTQAAVDAYLGLDRLGGLGSVAAYRDGQLVAGLWGVAAGPTLSIMSMFHRESRAGTLALTALVDDLIAGGRWSVIDCGTLNDVFRRFGAQELPAAILSELIWSGVCAVHGVEHPLETARRFDGGHEDAPR